MSDNRLALIQKLEALPLLDARYSNLRCVNFNSSTGAKRGCFSLVFKADDVVDGKSVALKFFDIDPENLKRTYRRDSFAREHELLQKLLNEDRCLQLSSSMKTFDLTFDE